MAGHGDLIVVLGNQLFSPAFWRERYPDAKASPCVFMAEDIGLCTYVRHHQAKITLFLSAMRSHADAMREAGFDVRYLALDQQTTKQQKQDYEAKLHEVVKQVGAERLILAEVEDRFFEHRLNVFAKSQGIELVFVPSPMFLTRREDFAAYLDQAKGKPFMGRFYTRQRKQLGMLLDDDGKPTGGQWSFDADNRKKLPKRLPLPPSPVSKPTKHTREVIALVHKRFSDHPGELSINSWWLPTTRRASLVWLREFLTHRFAKFGDYEDALSTRGDVLFHSALSPLMNLGLLTPEEVLEQALQHAEQQGAPINSVEGFVRQIIGWREFVRGVDRHFGEAQSKSNFFDHRRGMTQAWWNGDTGLLPLDDTIHKVNRLGWCHHIERLMILSNLMNLCEIEPRQVYDWFLAMFVDAADWVMGPNVYGMGLMSDGGVFATKPYICGSNYILKMSDYRKPKPGPPSVWGDAEANWCTVMDGLYWRFVSRHRDFFLSNPRMAMMARSLDKMDRAKAQRLFSVAEQFIERVTVPARG